MLKNALQPSLLDCKVTWDLPKGCNAESVPNPLPAVFSGESLVVYGVLSLTKNKDVKPLIGTVTVTATLSTASGDEQVTHKVSFEGVSSPSGENKLLHRLAAKALIQAKQQHQDDLNRDDEKEEIIRLSKSANVISKLTSFVAVDKENHEPVSRPMTKPPPNMLYSLDLMMADSYCSSAPAFKSKMKKKSMSCLPSFTFRRREKRKTKSMMSSNSPINCQNTGLPPEILRKNDQPVDSDTDSIEDDEELEGDLPLPAFGSSSPPKGNDLLDLVSLQKASGSWQLTEQLARICGVTMDKLKETCPSQLKATNKQSLWATALALSCLFGKFKDKKDEWEMVAGKGIKWLKKTIDIEALTYENIMEMADNALGN